MTIKIGILSCIMLLLPYVIANNAQPTKTRIQSSSNDEQQALIQYLKKTVAHSQSFDDQYHAEVWLISQAGKLKRFIKDPQLRLRLLKNVHQKATAAELNPDVVLALIEVESSFRQFALSHVGAQGLMQIMPFWRDAIGRPQDNLMNMETNLDYGCHILAFYLKKEKGHLAKALARYHGSHPKLYYSEKVLTRWQNQWKTD